MSRSGQICAAKSQLQARFVIVHTAASIPARISASVKASSGPTTLLTKQMTSHLCPKRSADLRQV